MNCRNCNTRIDYNYVTNCPHCGREVEEGGLPQFAPSMESSTQNQIWRYRLPNLLYVLITSAVGMVSGSVITYFSVALLYITLRSPETRPGEHCAEGMALGMLSILVGAFLGTVGGTAFAVKHPIGRSAIQ